MYLLSIEQSIQTLRFSLYAPKSMREQDTS